MNCGYKKFQKFLEGQKSLNLKKEKVKKLNIKIL